MFQFQINERYYFTFDIDQSKRTKEISKFEADEDISNLKLDPEVCYEIIIYFVKILFQIRHHYCDIVCLLLLNGRYVGCVNVCLYLIGYWVSRGVAEA